MMDLIQIEYLSEEGKVDYYCEGFWSRIGKLVGMIRDVV